VDRIQLDSDGIYWPHEQFGIKITRPRLVRKDSLLAEVEVFYTNSHGERDSTTSELYALQFRNVAEFLSTLASDNRLVEFTGRVTTLAKQVRDDLESQSKDQTEETEKGLSPSERDKRIQTSVVVEELVEQYRETYIFIHETKEWMRYEAKEKGIWSEIPDECMRQCLQDRLREYYPKGYEWGKVTGAENMLKNYLHMDYPSLPLNELPYTNGILDTPTMKFSPHEASRYCTWTLGYPYDSAAQCQPIIDWLYEAMQGDKWCVDVIRAFFNAILKRRVDLQVYLECIGPGGTGKGTTTRLAMALVGTRNVKPTELVQLESNRFEISQIKGKRLIIITDEDRYGGGVANLKKLVGQDYLRSETKNVAKHGDFVADGLVMVSANEPIQSSDYTSGLARRRITIPFKVQPGKERRLIEFEGGEPVGEFAEYLSGLANWALALTDAEVTHILKNATLESPVMYAVKMENLLATNPIAAWANDRLAIAEDPEKTIKVGSLKPSEEDTRGYANTNVWLYPSYVEYTTQSGHKPVASNRFTSLLEDLLFSQLKLDGVSRPPRDRVLGSHFKGLALRREGDEETPLFITDREMARPAESENQSEPLCEGENDSREGSVKAQVIECDEREGSEGSIDVLNNARAHAGARAHSNFSPREKNESASRLHKPENSSHSNTSAFTDPTQALHGFTDASTSAFMDSQLLPVPSSAQSCKNCEGTDFSYGVTTITCRTCGHIEYEGI